MKILLHIFSLILLFNSYLYPQFYNVGGVVKDSQADLPLSYANIRIKNTSKGTASNVEGKYELKLEEGKKILIASYIGYKSDTLIINVDRDLNINFNLSPAPLEISEITVRPSQNPAINIIRKAIEKKNQLNETITNYKYSSYTKGLIKTTRDFADGTVALSTKDTGDLKITGILENESRGFFRKPDLNKHYIVARKQTANTPPFINILTGGLLIQSFYENNLLFMGLEIPSPISNNALDYYYYYIEREQLIDDNKVYQIYFNTENESDPGFFGKLFIEDSTFLLLKADVNLNQMANPGGLFEFVRIYQQFSKFKDSITLPIDYRLFAEGNYLGLAKFGFELHTIMSEYEINTEFEEGLFDQALITVLPGADQKNENYWNSIQSIPSTLTEQRAYSRIDSLMRVSKTFGQDFSFLDSRIDIQENIALNGPINLYSFNKVEGHTLNLSLYYDDGATQRFNYEIGTSYGFADDLVKKYLSTSYKFGEFRTSQLSLKLFDNISELFGASDNYNRFTSTFLSLVTKYDFRDYYYSKGFDLEFNSEISPVVKIGLGYFIRHDESAVNRSDFSFFYRKRSFPENSQIYDSYINGLNLSLSFDFRKFIEDGFFRRRITPRNYLQFGGSIKHSSKELLNSDLNFTVYKLESSGRLSTIGNWSLDFNVNNIFSRGNVPYQWLYALPGNINAGGKNNSFRTLKIGEIFGDKVTTIFLNHNFNDDLFKYVGIPLLEDLKLQLSWYLNIALSEISKSSNEILFNTDYNNFKKPFYELGFSIGHFLIPLKFEFTWKLNYRFKNNFVFGINTFAF